MACQNATLPLHLPLLPNESHQLLPKSFSVTTQNTSDTPFSELQGYALVACSTIGFSSLNFFTHVAEEEYHFAVAPAILIRAFMQFIFTIIYFLFSKSARQGALSLTRRQFFFVVLRGLTGTGSAVFLSFALRMLPVGDATSLYMVSPIITLLLAASLLGEPISGFDISAALFTFVGVILVAQPHFDQNSPSANNIPSTIVGSLLALTAAFFSASAVITIRYLGIATHFMISVFSVNFCLLCFSIIMSGRVDLPSLLHQVGRNDVLVSSMSGFMAEITVTMGLQRCRAGRGNLMKNLTVPLAYGLGMVFLGEKPQSVRLLGSSFILLSALSIGIRQVISLDDNDKNIRR